MGTLMSGSSSAISADPASIVHGTAGSIMQATMLSLTTWLPAFNLIVQAKTRISLLELSRHLGVNHTTWLLHNRNLKAISKRD